MRFKLDENFGTRTQNVFMDAGHDVQTVRSQGLQGAADIRLYEICQTERYCLVTLDLDFSDVIRFPPSETSGIVVLRVHRNPSIALLEQLIREFLHALGDTHLDGALWVVEPGRVWIHQSKTDQ